jgi:phospholipid-binding lipoprotein MlaA
MNSGSRYLCLALLVCIGLTTTGCAHNPQMKNSSDPWEPLNRKVYVFNEGFDRYFMKPVAKGYKAVTPAPAEQGVSNFYANLSDFTTAFNDFLQLKFWDGVSDSGRFLINSTVGIVGLVDVASKMGLEKHNEDFGQTLGRWGVPSGPYLMIPFLGPSTARDGPSLIVDYYTAPQTYFVDQVAIRNTLWALDFINTRAELLSLDAVLDDVAYDKYDLLRDAYLTRRKYLVTDGRSQQQDSDELMNELESME